MASGPTRVGHPGQPSKLRSCLARQASPTDRSHVIPPRPHQPFGGHGVHRPSPSIPAGLSMRSRGSLGDAEPHERHRSLQPHQALRRPRGGRRCLVLRRGGRDLRHPRTERCRQDDDRRIDRRPADAGRRHDQLSWGSILAATAPAPQPRRRPAPGKRAAGSTDGRRGARSLRVLLRAAGRSRRTHRKPRAPGQARHGVPKSVRWPEAAPLHRAGACRQAAHRDPRRALHRARPPGASGDMAADRVDPRSAA